MLPSLFSYQWIRSCLAINSTSGHINWVANGNLVLTGTFGRAKLPESLTGKLILGVEAYKDSTQWYALSNKVANLNIFSTLLVREVLESMTRGGISWENEGGPNMYNRQNKALASHPENHRLVLKLCKRSKKFKKRRKEAENPPTTTAQHQPQGDQQAAVGMGWWSLQSPQHQGRRG